MTQWKGSQGIRRLEIAHKMSMSALWRGCLRDARSMVCESTVEPAYGNEDGQSHERRFNVAKKRRALEGISPASVSGIAEFVSPRDDEPSESLVVRELNALPPRETGIQEVVRCNEPCTQCRNGKCWLCAGHNGRTCDQHIEIDGSPRTHL